MNRIYVDTARLLTQVAPLVFVDDRLVLKGGTAINLFIRDMPRLSVDLDLVFTDHIIRGTVHPERQAGLTKLARDTLLAEIEIPVLAPEDVYAGKLVAALDRQHPRDLFDVMQLFAHEGITAAIRHAFVVYLASHNRPVHEVLFPQLRNIRADYEQNFVGMTTEPVELAALIEACDRMIKELQAGLDTDERRFLLSFVGAEPDWKALGVAHVSDLPAVRWKLHNLARLKRERPKQFELQYTALAERLGE